jgi:RNA polymerase sigma-70 factor, ECF subfamily
VAAAAAMASKTCTVESADRELAARASRNPEAFAALYERWAPRVRRFATARLGDADDAEDVVQEVFVALLRSLDSYEGRSRFGTWLLGIAHHKACRLGRRRLRAEPASFAAPPERACAALDADARLDAVRALERCARTLERDASAGQRAAFWLAYAGCLSAGEAARELRCSPESVRAQLSRVRRLLLERAPGLAETLRS